MLKINWNTKHKTYGYFKKEFHRSYGQLIKLVLYLFYAMFTLFGVAVLLWPFCKMFGFI
jgi:hypothetical protein